ncbi:Condensation domain-containing protein [Chitinophaga costaii]|uniref:Condensation domain-containing protein n=1 Tax=Chitinophaga costaii TaxID=1335309 RepID=A0A1C3YUL0_9BACT|nr:condensation domain-containing protein [Chitinophaga costaii]PUZ30111.1 hypothetical protein DCM91_01145 [Chitinophaga costaii]SCB73739.1 Condensation domain-containing protein [Chitinophaga costaii]
MPVAKIFASSATQRREWMLYHVRSDKAPFNLELSLRLDAFDLELNQQIMLRMLEQYEIFRTTLQVIDGTLYQVIHTPDTFVIDFDKRDLTHLEPAAAEAAAREMLKASLLTPFDIEQGPLFRILVMEYTPHDLSVHFIFHHLVTDQYSTRLFVDGMKEMAALFLSGGQHVFDPAVQYSAYVRFEQELLNTSRGDKYRNYWESVLKNGMPMLRLIKEPARQAFEQRHLQKVAEVKDRLYKLPFVDERFVAPVIRRYEMSEGGEIHYAYPTDTFTRIERYRRQCETGLLTLMVAGIMLSLHQHSGQETFVFEIMASKRPDQHFMQTIGWLATGGPCFFNIAGKEDAGDLLEYVDEQLYQLSKHVFYPYESVLYNATPPIGSRIPVFISLTHFEQQSGRTEEGITFRKPAGAGNYQDLALFFNFYQDAGEVQLYYNNELFDLDSMEALLHAHAGFIAQLLGAVV